MRGGQSHRLRVGVIRIRGHAVAKALGDLGLKRVVPILPEGGARGREKPAVLRERHQRLANRLSLREVAIGEELREADGCECLLLCRGKARIWLY